MSSDRITYTLIISDGEETYSLNFLPSLYDSSVKKEAEEVARRFHKAGFMQFLLFCNNTVIYNFSIETDGSIKVYEDV